MGTWRRGVVVGRTCGRKRVKKPSVSTENRHGRSIVRKLRRLQNIIPGGRGAAGQDVDTEALFQKIAVYICLLESRVKVLQSVYALFGPHE